MADLTQPVIAAVRAYQVLEDTDPIRAALGVAATADLDGEPVWLQQVGGPSCGKSEAISMLADAVDGKIGELTAGGLLGWTGGQRNGRKTGLLARIGDGDRLVTISDFSTVLGVNDRKVRAHLFNLLRVLYDGYVIRDIHGPPEPLEWAGRLTVVSAVTPAIDAFSSHADALGPRWLYIRIPELSRRGRKRASELAREHGGRKQELREAAREQAAHAVRVGRSRAADVTLDSVNGDQIEDAAIIATLARSAIPRESYRQEVTGVVIREEPFRMITVLVLLYRGLVAVGAAPRVARRITMRCAMDSIPLARRQALDALAAGEVLTTSEVARRMGADRRVARIALEDLELLGIARGKRCGTRQDDAEMDGESDRLTREWRLGGEDGKLAGRVLSEVSRSVESTHTSPPNKTPAPHTSAHPPPAEQIRAAEGR